MQCFVSASVEITAEEAARNWNCTRTDVFSCSRFVNKKIIGLNIEQVFKQSPSYGLKIDGKIMLLPLHLN